MSEHCEACKNSGGQENGCPGVTCQQCADMWEALNAKDAEISRLRALVAVGREMADAIETYSYGVRAIAAKWRSLDGER